MKSDLNETTSLRRLLFELLERYETSKSYGKPGPWRRDVILKLDESAFPNAFKQDGRDEYNALQGAVDVLLERSAARANAFPGVGNDTWKEVRLGPNELANAYELANPMGFVPLDGRLSALQFLTTKFLERDLPHWLVSFLSSVGTDAAVANVSRLGAQRLTFKRDQNDIFDSLKAVVELANGFEGWERIFSERVFGNSKRFLKIRARTVDLLVRADPRWEGIDASDAPEILSHYGIRRRPGFITCSGGAHFRIYDSVYRLEDYGSSANLPEEWVPALANAIKDRGPIQVTTIENEYPFFAYVEEHGGCNGLGRQGEFVVYTGGFPSKSTLQLLKALSTNSLVKFRHWGDADVGGVKIWLYLRRELNVPIAIFRTSADWYNTQATEDTTALTQAELMQLAIMRAELQRLTGSDFASVIQLIDSMSLMRVKIEQERY